MQKTGYFDQMAEKDILQLFVQNGCFSPLVSEGNDVPLRKENRKCWMFATVMGGLSAK